MTHIDSPLIQAMLESPFYDHTTDHIKLIETHISWVLLTGEFAYKIKKPVDFGFLNFTQLSQRKHFCEEELRLNKRLAANIYLEVLPVSQIDEKFYLNDTQHIIEYVVKMKQFPQNCLLTDLVDHQQLNTNHITCLANKLAAFHQQIVIAPTDSTYGDIDEVIKPIEQNFKILEPLITSQTDTDHLKTIKQASLSLYQQLRAALQQRKAEGFIRECHGDMHLGNIAWVNDDILIFDGIEFNDSLKWIDVISELAFLIMDLDDHQQSNYANQVLNQYLALSGDYAGLQILIFYLLYRAMVRAKVTGLRLQQQDKDTLEYQKNVHALKNYLSIALSYLQPQQTFIAIMHGISGSGKSWASMKLASETQSIVIRSDVERKRLFSDNPDDLYSKQTTEKTYQRLQQLCTLIIESGYSVIIDATFLELQYRTTFYNLAHGLKQPFRIIDCYADKQTIKRRITQRADKKNEVSDADLAVMQAQANHFQDLTIEEQAYTIKINTAKDDDFMSAIKQLQTIKKQ